MPSVKAKSTKRLPTRLWRFSIGGLLLASGAFIDDRTAAAPSVIANQAPEQPLQTQDQIAEPDEMNVFQPAEPPGGNSLPRVFQYGPLQLRPHFDYRFMYGNGIQANPGDQEATVIQELSPGIVVDLGPRWAVNYTPTFRFYSSDKFEDTVDHAVTLTGGFAYQAWKFGLSHSSQFTSAPRAETGTQTEQSTHGTSFSAVRAFNDKISADFSLNQQITLVSGFQDSYDWSTIDWLNYQFWPRFNAGIGGGAGYVSVNDNSKARTSSNLDQTYETVQARANWRATDKISFQINGGLEDRQFKSAGASDSLNPIFGASIQYQPFESTRLSLNASRTVSSSDYYLLAQQTEVTILSVNLDQRLFRKFNLGMGFAYTTTEYNTSVGAVSGGAVNRSDDEVSFNIRLSHPFYKRGTWSIFYQYSDNQSSESGFAYQSNQTGFEISYSY